MVNIYNISPRYSFLDVLAKYVLETAKEQNLNIANDLILLPTRRSCRYLKEIFFNLNGKNASLLPTIRSLGDIDENGIALLDYENEELEIDLPPAISSIERNLILSSMVKVKMKDLSEEQTYSLAVDLAHLMDTVEMEELSFDNLKNIVSVEYSEHWQETLEFLKIITEEYPKVLAYYNLINPVARKVKLIEKQIDFWKKYPRKGRIFAGGSTGSLVPIAKMLKTIANMKNGFLILPGLDKNISDSDFEILTSDLTLNQNHPQYGLLKLIKGLSLKVSDIPELPLYENYDIAPQSREALSSYIMLSPQMNDSWENLRKSQKFEQNTLDGVSEITFDDESEEVLGLSLLLRKSIEENKKTLLITPDRKIAKSVSNKLKRWNVLVDDSAGIPASDTITGNYFLLVLKMIYDDFSPYSLLAVLKHKYTHLGYSKEALETIITKFEKDILRLYGNVKNIEDIEALLNLSPSSLAKKSPRYNSKQTESSTPIISDLIKRVKGLTNDFYTLMKSKEKYNLYDLLVKHIQLVESFVSSEEINTNDTLYSSDLHEQFSSEIRDLLDSLKVLKNKKDNLNIDCMTASAYFVFISNYFLSLNLRPTIGTDSNIAIMNSIEARLLPADLYIMSGLTDGVFPSVSSDDPWMNRAMKASFGLPLPERKIGLSSHDFIEFFCKKNVIMTHSSKIDKKTTITSRWLSKFSAIKEICNIKTDDYVSKEVKSWINNFNIEKNISRYLRPAPKLPKEIRMKPIKFSATEIETFLKDPYEIFVKKFLSLYKQDEINSNQLHIEFGDIIHNALDIFVKNNYQTSDELLNLMQQQISPTMNISQIDFWKPRFKEIAEWFVKSYTENKNKIQKSIVEEKGSFEFIKDFILEAKADRIDVLTDGTLSIMDYKTGNPPSEKSVKRGDSPQLLVETIIAENNGYKNLPKNSKVSEIKYIKLKKDDLGHEIIIDDIEDAVNNLQKILFNTVKEFRNEDTPFYSQPNESKKLKFSNYDHLARIKEWKE